tara:strand:+ start:75 stop:1016 length:942 start_codon:yes stop_codon:yes gene_type:complete
MRTFKQLQDAVLQWMADGSDTGLLRDLVSNSINEQHQQLLHEDRYDFMLWPRTESLAVVSGQSAYALHPEFDQPLYFFNPNTEDYLEEIPAKSLLESGADWDNATPTEPIRFMLAGISKLKKQPTADGVVAIATTGGTESASNQIIVSGIDNNGDYVNETLSSGAPWTTLTSTTSFEVVLDITKIGASWARLVTVTSGSDTLLTLNADEFGRQYRMMEIIGTPAGSSTIKYRFYRKPRYLVKDNDIPDLPESHDDILVLKALTAMQGYSRATDDEQAYWRARLSKLDQSLKMTYQQARSLGGRPTFTRFIPRG